MEKLLLACSLLALSSVSQAATQTWDFTNGSSASNMNRNIVPNSISLSDVGNTMSVMMTAWSAYNDENIFQSELWLSQWGLLAFNAQGEHHYVDNVGRYDFVLLQFDQDVELSGINIDYFGSDSDISIAAFNSNPFQGSSAATRWQQVAGTALSTSSFANVGQSSTQYYALNSGVNAAQLTSGVSASFWLVGAYNSYFGAGSGLGTGNDSVKLAGLTTTTSDFTQVSAPATLSLFALSLFALVGRRRRK